MLSLVTILILVNSVSAQRRNGRRMGIGGIIAGAVIAICAVLFLLCIFFLCARRIRARRGLPTDTSQSRFGMKPLFGGPWGWSGKGAKNDGMYPQAQQPFDPNHDVAMPPPVYGHNAGVQGKV